MTTSELIAELIACGTPTQLVAEVARRLFKGEAELDALAQSRKANAERQQRWRARNVMSRYVTSNPVTLRHATSEKPNEIKETVTLREDRHISKKESKKEERKQVSAKTLLPEDFTLNDKDRAACRQASWTPEKLETELMRFRDHAAMNGRRCVDWHAAWRNWVRSPYQIKQANGGMNGYHGPAKPNAADVLRGIVEENRRRESPDFGGLLPQVRRG